MDYLVCSSLRDSLSTLNTCLIKGETLHDGEEYYLLDESHPFKDQFQSIIRELHCGEWPNNWRYEIVKGLAVHLLEYFGEEERHLDDYQDALYEVAESLTDVSTSRLFTWLAEIPSRAAFDDVVEDVNDLAVLARIRQTEEINTMGFKLLGALQEMSS
jgi:hypothetical protein